MIRKWCNQKEIPTLHDTIRTTTEVSPYMTITSPSASAVVHNKVTCSVLVINLLLVIKGKRINHNKHHDELKERTRKNKTFLAIGDPCKAK